jgi:hypothetical protein
MALIRQWDGITNPRNEESAAARPGEAPRGDFFRKESVPEIWEVRAGCIGRGHAGKTALFKALTEGPVGDFFPSGLHVDVSDPKEVAQLIREAEETQRLLQTSGLPPTGEAAQIRYYLYEGDQQRVVYKMREVIGQILTHTLPGSSPELQARYDEYLKILVNTHVLWVVVPCPPPNASARDRRRYANDLRITSAYLREALRLRTMEQPAAIALVLTKIDVLFKDPAEARSALTDEVLCSALGPLVHLVNQSSHVAEAVILPVTSFGFGNAVLREQAGDRSGAAPEESDDPFSKEPIWLLKEGMAPEPYNLDTLVIWTLFFGLLHQEAQKGPEGRAQIAELSRRLRDDLLEGGHWFLPVKSQIAQARG